MSMAVKTFFIKAPQSWESASSSFSALSRGCATTVRFAGAIEELEDAAETIDVVIMSVTGMADYALEIYHKGMLDLPNDTIGMHLACYIKADVLVPDNVEGPPWWFILRPDATLDRVLLDVDKLEMSQVEYRIAEPGR